MSPARRVLVGLLAGLAAGIALGAWPSPVLSAVAGWVEPLGTVWVDALRMTVIPLVVALLLAGVASTDAGVVGRIGGRAVVWFVSLLLLVALLTLALAPPLLGVVRIDPQAAAGLRAEASGRLDAGAAVPDIGEWLVGLVPANPVAAAAEGDMLPLIVFTLIFAMAITTLAAERRRPVLAVAEGIGAASLIVIGWVLSLAPVGVFALALALARRLGVAAAGALGTYVLVHSALAILLLLALYPLAAAAGRVGVRDFARALLPAQAVAFSSRSSLAALPPLVEAAEEDLGLPAPVVSFFVPFSVAVFRLSAPLTMCIGALFTAQLYGVGLSPPQYATLALTSTVAAFTVPGVPGGGVVVMVPVLMATGLPVEAVGLLLAVDTIPDSFRTTANVTAHLALATALSRGLPASRPLVGGALP